MTFLGGDFAITKWGLKISFRKNPRTSSTREFPDEVLDVGKLLTHRGCVYFL
jgi:hypothetical protein